MRISDLQSPLQEPQTPFSSLGILNFSSICLGIDSLTNRRITEAEDRISEVEDRMVEINEAESKKLKTMKRNEDNLRDLWDNVKRPCIQIIGVTEEEEKRKAMRQYLRR